MNASAICFMNFLQLMVKPCGETTSELQTASIFGPVPLKVEVELPRSAKPRCDRCEYA